MYLCTYEIDKEILCTENVHACGQVGCVVH